MHYNFICSTYATLCIILFYYVRQTLVKFWSASASAYALAVVEFISIKVSVTARRDVMRRPHITHSLYRLPQPALLLPLPGLRIV